MKTTVDSILSTKYYDGCPNATVELLRKFQIDTAKREAECANQSCYMLFYTVASWLSSTEWICPVKDIATNSIVAPKNINCTNVFPAFTVTPGPTYTFSPSTTATPSTGSPSSTGSNLATSSPGSSSSNTTTSSSGGSDGSSAIIIVVVVAVVVVILIGLFVVWRIKRSKQHSTNQTTNGGTNFHVLGETTKQTTSVLTSRDDALEMLALWNIPPSEIVLEERLAEGAFGEVWRATYRGENVAVKTLLKHKSSRSDLEIFIEEIKLMAKMECPAIVQFIGVSYHRVIDLKLVTEFMGGGDLRTFLQVTLVGSFPMRYLLQVALRIADALVYLHVMDPKVIHRDLKSRNVLMDPEKGAKVTDFGVSREAMDQETLTQGVGTYRWMAPEVLTDGHYSTSADIYSFGIVLSELTTHQLPYADMTNANGHPLSDTAIIAQVMRGDLQPTFRHEPRFVQLNAFAKKCLDITPSKRPTAMEAAYFLRLELRAVDA
ncbi:unnamed protein product [Aphanomyces euteiches]|uniref:Protein kinase domain-containing protein n=1 Tax=Aphanomyces euteiches TaxID=100861 RepID=A0A6G0X2K9_9STRA|nr:hypothetical protein Ae201684_009221 [Aphanomyces euteiches]